MLLTLLQVMQEIPLMPEVSNNIEGLKSENGFLRYIIYALMAVIGGLFVWIKLLINRLLDRAEKDADMLREKYKNH